MQVFSTQEKRKILLLRQLNGLLREINCTTSLKVTIKICDTAPTVCNIFLPCYGRLIPMCPNCCCYFGGCPLNINCPHCCVQRCRSPTFCPSPKPSPCKPYKLCKSVSCLACVSDNCSPIKCTSTTTFCCPKSSVSKTKTFYTC